MNTLLDYFRHKHDSQFGRAKGLHPDAVAFRGWETRTAMDRYYWHGLRRGAEANHPCVIFQVTLEGGGVYESDSAREILLPGRAFAAVVPSDHCYYLPSDSPSWTFFWVLLRHPYVVQRIAERQRTVGMGATVLPVTKDSVLVARTIALWESSFPDRFAEEQALFEFLIEYERHVAAVCSGGNSQAEAAEGLREEARRAVLSDLARPLDVAEIARLRGMSRSRYSHFFKAATGDSPARFMLDVRLEEVARRLVHTDLTLIEIARETGFADANHLCKAFRRHFHLSPGAFRRQMR